MNTAKRSGLKTTGKQKEAFMSGNDSVSSVFHRAVSEHGVEKRWPCEKTVLVTPGERRRPERPRAGDRWPSSHLFRREIYKDAVVCQEWGLKEQSLS